jgi:hypothetical protein
MRRSWAGWGCREIAPQIFRLLTAITNEHGEPWQITKAKKLIHDDWLRSKTLADYGRKVPAAQ